jgi:hypothetical protein
MRLKNAGDPDFDPELEKAKLDAVKIEHVVYDLLSLAKQLLTDGRHAYLVYILKDTQNLVLSNKEDKKWKELSKEAAVGAVKNYRLMADLMPELDEILRLFGDKFEPQDREDYASISLLLTELTKNFGQKKWWRIYAKNPADEELVELGNYLLLNIIETGYVYGDKIPMERRQNHMRIFLGLENARIPDSCPIHAAGN